MTRTAEETTRAEGRLGPMRVGRGRCKGIPLKAIHANTGRLFGEKAQRALLEQVPSELREALSYGRIVASGWYPLSWLSAMHREAQVVTGSGGELSRRFGYLGAKESFSGVYQVFIGLMNPSFVISKTAVAFGKYYEIGHAESTLRSRGHAELRFQGCDGFDANLWLAVFGACEAVLELSGGRNIRVRVLEGGGDGETHATLGAYWT